VQHFIKFVQTLADIYQFIILEMTMVRWMCDIMLKDRVPSKGLRDTSIRRHNHCSRAKQVVMYGHVLQKDDNDSVKKCIKWRVPGQEADQRKLGQRLCQKTVSHVN